MPKRPAPKPQREKPAPAAPGNRWRRPLLLAALGGLAILAPLGALGLRILQVPDRVPPALTLLRQRPLSPLITAALLNPQPSVLEVSLPEINAHLAQSLPPAGAGPEGGEPAFLRMGFRIRADACEVLSIFLWRGRELHLNALYSVTLRGTKLDAQLVSGSLGRLELNAFWMRFLEPRITRELKRLRKEHTLLARLESLRLDEDKATLRIRASAGAAQPNP